MIFFISTAMADAAAGSGASGLMSFLPMLFFIGVIYFLLIRPQQKRAKQHQLLIASVKKGDKVVTNSGIIGTVVKVLNDQEVLIEIADKVFVKFVKSTISTVVNPNNVVAPVQKTEKPAEKSSEAPVKAPVVKSSSVKKPVVSTAKSPVKKVVKKSSKPSTKKKPANKKKDIKK